MIAQGVRDVVVFGVHVKTQRSGGAENHGWPDEHFLDRLHSECVASDGPLGKYPWRVYILGRYPPAICPR